MSSTETSLYFPRDYITYTHLLKTIQYKKGCDSVFRDEFFFSDLYVLTTRKLNFP